jgi:hypothetical protein
MIRIGRTDLLRRRLRFARCLPHRFVGAQVLPHALKLRQVWRLGVMANAFSLRYSVLKIFTGLTTPSLFPRALAESTL